MLPPSILSLHAAPNISVLFRGKRRSFIRGYLADTCTPCPTTYKTIQQEHCMLWDKKRSIVPGSTADPCYLGAEKLSLLPVFTRSYFTCSSDNCESIVPEFWTDSSKARGILRLSCLLPMCMLRAPLQLWTICRGICSVPTLPTLHMWVLTHISHLGITESCRG